MKIAMFNSLFVGKGHRTERRPMETHGLSWNSHSNFDGNDYGNRRFESLLQSSFNQLLQKTQLDLLDCLGWIIPYEFHVTPTCM